MSIRGSGSNTTSIGRGTGYTLARLERDKPELAAEVRAGAMTAHAAAIVAGFRRKTWTAPTDPARLAAAIRRRYPQAERARLAVLLLSGR